MELRVLRYFLTVAQEENITKAAALLHVTQPTLSRQLMQLEEELGSKLFRRSQYRVILTDAGMLLRRRAQEIVELADKTEREFAQSEEELSGEIAIGCGETQSMTFLSQHIRSFRSLYPKVQFRIYSGGYWQIRISAPATEGSVGRAGAKELSPGGKRNCYLPGLSECSSAFNWAGTSAWGIGQLVWRGLWTH